MALPDIKHSGRPVYLMSGMEPGMKLVFLLFLLLPHNALAQPTLHCEGDDVGEFWTYDITLESGHATIIYKFRDWTSEYVSPVFQNKFKVPSPHEFEKHTYLEKMDYGWDLKFYEFDGTPSPYFPDEFFCIEN